MYRKLVFFFTISWIVVNNEGYVFIADAKILNVMSVSFILFIHLIL